MAELSWDEVLPCLGSGIPAQIATASTDGVPNVTYISQVHPVDDRHVALSWQFFNKTARNLRDNPHAVVQVVHPSTGRQFRIDLAPLRIERSGPVFEQMRKELVAIATQTGMTGLFRLRGALICQILSFQAIPCADQLCSQPKAIGLTAVAALSERLAICSDLNGLVDGLLAGLVDDLELGAAIVFMLDEDGGRLSAIASRGYDEAEIGSEVSLGIGTAGVAAAERCVVRVGGSDLLYSRAIRGRVEEEGGFDLASEIRLPGIEDVGSQLAVPICVHERVLGVVLVESPASARYGRQEQQAVQLLAHQIGPLMLMHGYSPAASDAPDDPSPPSSDGVTTVRYFAQDESIFLGQEYLIRGVAARILHLLVAEYADSGRTTWTNRELRADARIGLPAYNDNLEARLILLRKRLEQRDAPIRMVKRGRGRFELAVSRPLRLEEQA